MTKIKKPDVKQSEIYDAFDNLQYRNILEKSSKKYDKYFEDLKSLYDFENEKIKKDSEYKEYIKKMYSERFSNKNYTNLYKFYLKIREITSYCPYCNFPSHSIKQVDHFFPKSTFPSLSLTIENLIPVCTDCNKNKLDYFSLNSNEMLLHPYYDDVLCESFDFIHCDVIEDDHIGFIFSIRKLGTWNDDIFNRVMIHFKKFELDTLYSSDFETDFSVYIEELKELYNDCNIEGVKENLKRKIRAYKKSNIKPWYYAGYTAILNNVWFFEHYIIKFKIPSAKE